MKLKILVIGRGRVGRSLARAWARAGHEVSLAAHDSRRPVNAKVIVLSVPDRAVAEVAASWADRFLKGSLCIHTAGALDLLPLRALRNAGMRVGSLHPLAAIPSPKTEARGAWAAIESSPKDAPLLRRLARDAGFRAFAKPVRDRGHYHLGAVLAANSQPPLLELALSQLRRAGISEREARSALAILAKSAVDAWLERGGPEGLTGPVVRGDAATLRHHLATLSAGNAREVYLALARAALELAALRRPVPQGLAEVARALR
jgi:predicted short-subunit dehydrogenase-like oxidoreductase (DUF2520 family)